MARRAPASRPSIWTSIGYGPSLSSSAVPKLTRPIRRFPGGGLPGARRWFRALLCVLLATGFAPASAAGFTVAAASSLRLALDEVIGRFAAASDYEARVSYGSSSDLSRQIAQGAPFDLFLAADEISVDQLHEAGVTRDRGVLYALGRIALFAPTDSPLARADFQALRKALRKGALSRFVIPNPEHAPYGEAARKALQRKDLWDLVQPHLIMGENAAQAVSYVTSGAAQGGILPLSLMRVPELARRGRYRLIRFELHRPIRHRMVLLKDAGPAARRFYAYLQNAASREIFERYGFELP